MREPRSSRLEVTEHAAHQVNGLEAPVKQKFATFQAKFTRDREHPGLNFERLNSRTKLYSARIDQAFRAVLFHVKGDYYLLVSVMHHDKVYDRLDERLRIQINQATGGIDVIDLDGVSGIAEPEPAAAALVAPKAEQPGLFDPFTDAVLEHSGVPEILIPAVRALKSESDFARFCEHVKGHPSYALNRLLAGADPDDILDEITRPDGPVDLDDYESAAERPVSRIASADEVTAAALAGEFAAWRLFLHPRQRELVRKDFTGPAKVSGGPGTGKTVVLMHRAVRLAREGEGPVLVTAYNQALGKDLEHKLRSLGGKETSERISVLRINQLAARIVRDATGQTLRMIKEADETAFWMKVILDAGETEFSPAFLKSEWNEVICDQGITERAQYFSAGRVGRAQRLSRKQRARVWELAERFEQLLDNGGQTTWNRLATKAALLAEAAAARGEYRYRHTLVDEAQDFSPTQWRLLRAVTEPGTNDLFIVGDTHQRIKGRQLSLSPLGIKVQGRSRRLKLNYRTSREVLLGAVTLLDGVEFDDLDEGIDHLSGYQSILTGGEVTHAWAADGDGEAEAAVKQIERWRAEDPRSSIGVAASTWEVVTRIRDRLERQGIEFGDLPDSVDSTVCVHLGTMHSMKGLEFQRVIMAGVGARSFPPEHLRELSDDGTAAVRWKRQLAKSLLFVTATRARDSVAVIWSGEPTPLLAGLR
jgi:hypothetical protein